MKTRALFLLDGCLQYQAAFYFAPATGRPFDQGTISAPSGEYKSPRLPSPQNWVLVLEIQEKK